MAITGYRKNLVDWNETGNNSKLNNSKANIKKEIVLIAKCEAHYEEAGVPLPKDIVTSMTVTLCKIRMAATYKVKDDARNDVSNAVANSARSDLRKKGNDPKQNLDEAEQVKFEKDRASIDKGIAKVTDLRKRDADPKQILETKAIKPG